MESYLASIILFAGNFAPRGWAFCMGQLLSISTNTALFSILGTTYGGDGQTTFALPDLRGRVPLQQGQGPGLSNYQIGEQGGTEAVTLTITEMPAHNHLLHVNTGAVAPGKLPAPGKPDSGTDSSTYHTATKGTMHSAAIGVNGGSQPHENRSPYLGLNYIICLEGIYPSRS